MKFEPWSTNMRTLARGKVDRVLTPNPGGIGAPARYKSGAQNNLFGRLRNFNGLYLRIEARHRQLAMCFDNYKGSSRWMQNVMNFGSQTASNWTAILPTLCKFCFLRHCQASQTEISEQNSTTLCQTVDANLC